MALYRLVSVKYSRREHKKDAQGKLMYRDEDKKVPIYELKSYGIGAKVDLNPAEAKRLKNDIQPMGGTVDQPTALQFVPDDSGEDESDGNLDTSKVLAGNVDQVLASIEEHADDEDALTALRDAELEGKARKGVLDALNDLLGE